MADYLHDFRGYSQKQKLMDDLSRFLLRSKLEWAYHTGVSRFSQEVALVIIGEPESKEILDIGGSLPGDLFVDNWGTVWAGLFRAPINGNTAVTLTDTSNTARQLYSMEDAGATFNASNAIIGSRIQVGSGTTAPARSDYKIQTAFATAPENALFDTGTGSYAAGSGNITVSGSITAGNEAGTINEAILAGVWYTYSAGAAENICICHDATTATAFSNAKSITVQYSIAD